jgi:hypothetical protein
MSVPSHNLYDFIYHTTERKFLLFYFYPWGEKDYTNVIDYQKSSVNLCPVNELSNIDATKFFPEQFIDLNLIRSMQPVLFCHDQEPLDFDFYQDDGLYMKKFFDTHLKNLPYPVYQQNLRSIHLWSMKKKWILLHSEKNSLQLKKYEETDRYQGAFWWSHAIIARDWYRYAQYDPSLEINKSDKKMFLIYARDSEGTRAYRKTVINRIQEISHQCQIGSLSQEIITAQNSAIYNVEDFVSTEISVVLETLFNDSRIHLTEKILRPLACGHPFILAAGANSLEFLKSYGFETFHPWIDESYDQEQDHDKRLDLIIKELHRIASLSSTDKQCMLENIRQIAQRNKQKFFSNEFLEYVVNELKQNIQTALHNTQDQFDIKFRWENIKWRKKNGLFVRTPSHNFITPLIRHCRVNKGLLEQYQCHQHGLDDKSSTDGDDV